MILLFSPSTITARLVTATLAVLALLPLAVTASADSPTVLAGGFDYMCSLVKTEGSVRCWGAKTQGGIASTGVRSNLPYPPLAVDNVVSVGAGEYAVCALRSDGSVICWGDNLHGGVGDAAVGSRSFPVPQTLAGLGEAATVLSSGGASDHHCAITVSFTAKCWGRNGSGQLGNGKFLTTHIPQTVTGLGPVSAIATGLDHTCAITLSGGVKCWGFAGLIGDGTGTSRPTPTQVSGLTSGIVQIAAGFQHTCAVTANGGVKCWGDGSLGQLGNGARLDSLVPVDVIGVTGAAQIATGRDYTCVLQRDGVVKCWGSRQQAGGGDGIAWTSSTTAQSSPVTVIGFSGPVVSIGASYRYACAVVLGGAIECWGARPIDGGSSALDASASSHVSSLTLDTRLIMSEQRHASLDYYFMTSRFQEKIVLKALAPDFQPTGRSFMVYPTGQQAGSKPITRFYFDKVAKSSIRGSHFYTLVDAERAALVGLNPSNANTPRLPQNEGTDSFAFAPAIEGVGGSCAAGQTPLYRAFRGNSKFPDDPNHRFTTDLALYSALVTSGWDGEGVKMCVSQ